MDTVNDSLVDFRRHWFGRSEAWLPTPLITARSRVQSECTETKKSPGDKKCLHSYVQLICTTLLLCLYFRLFVGIPWDLPMALCSAFSLSYCFLFLPFSCWFRLLYWCHDFLAHDESLYVYSLTPLTAQNNAMIMSPLYRGGDMLLYLSPLSAVCASLSVSVHAVKHDTFTQCLANAGPPSTTLSPN